MVSLSINILYALGLSMVANGLAIPDENSLAARDAKFLQFDLKANNVHSINGTNHSGASKTHSINKRARGDIPLKLLNHDTYYSFEVFIGSNKQPVNLQVSNIDADLWVTSQDAIRTTLSGPGGLINGGSFDSDLSSTWKDLKEVYYNLFDDYSSVQGTYGKDQVALPNGFVLKDFQFADITKSTSPYSGRVGLGYANNEALTYVPNNTPYPGFLELLKEQGAINKGAYSVYLGSPQSKAGTILFGGIDHAKVDGPLTPITIHSEQFDVNFKSVSTDSDSAQIGGTVKLDLTVSRSTFDDPSKIAKLFGATYNKQYEAYTFKSAPPSDKYLTFEFDNVKIKAPYSAFTDKLADNDGNDTGLWYVTIEKGSASLGVDFLRNAYVVIDVEAKTVSLGQVKYTGESRISAIQA